MRKKGGEKLMPSDNSFFINLGSLTLSHKAQKILADNKIDSTVVKKAITESGGCSWGIYVKNRKKEEVIVLLRAFSIKIL